MWISLRLLAGLFAALCLGVCSRTQETIPHRDLFGEDEAIHLEMKIDLPESEVTSEEARVYVWQQLAALGVPVVEAKAQEVRADRIPRLSISIIGRTGPVPDGASEPAGEPRRYEVDSIVEFWDEVIYKRDPSIQRYLPILYHVNRATFFSYQDYFRTAATWPGVRGALDQSLKHFKDTLQGEWVFDPKPFIRDREESPGQDQ